MKNGVMMNKAQAKAITKLNDAITNLPEFGALMKLVPSNVAITNCELTECETTREYKNGKKCIITYQGLVLQEKQKVLYPYVVECGEYLISFSSKCKLDAIVEDIKQCLTTDYKLITMISNNKKTLAKVNKVALALIDAFGGRLLDKHELLNDSYGVFTIEEFNK